MSLPLTTLSSLLTLQDDEDNKPRLSKISWLPDILVVQGSIIPTVIGPVLSVTLFSAGVAAAALVYGKEVGLTNNVVPLLSVVVALLLGHNSSAYERFAEGRKDFTSLISNSRNLSRLIWVSVCLPPSSPDGTPPPISRDRLTEEKKRLIRLIVAFVIATKHHLRAEGGVHHEDLQGLLPPRLAGSSLNRLKTATGPGHAQEDFVTSPQPIETSLPPTPGAGPASDPMDEESSVGLSIRSLRLSTSQQSMGLTPGSAFSDNTFDKPSFKQRAMKHLHPGRSALKRRPTNVRVIEDGDPRREEETHTKHPNERTPLIKPGVKPDIRRKSEATDVKKRAEAGLGRMVELGLPLIIAHEISRTIFRFRRMGCLEAVGPAGMNAMQGLVQGMTDQLGSMERIVQTPLPVIFGIHLKQTVTLFLFILPFTLVDVMGWKMVVIVTCCAFTMMGVEHIAAQVEMPFGDDPCDLNLDLYCTELLCECEALLERLPEGDEDDEVIFERSSDQKMEDEAADDGGD
ncbi:hypothetical protein M231_02704 [Tremella mesenterica]|uniref:Bestrophin, RFP-TM, chloride channel-domain-containing protein n=1 Tax=Tremella mesenterica TaxID=5217 RepID=A0A4Q1BQ66_TREME|nr:hypothetical protein M231_02704 [Tremella mesenterica]